MAMLVVLVPLEMGVAEAMLTLGGKWAPSSDGPITVGSPCPGLGTVARLPLACAAVGNAGWVLVAVAGVAVGVASTVAVAAAIGAD